MKRILLCLCIFCFFLSKTFAQQNYKAGLIVKNSDTVRGFIDYGNWRTNPRTIKFKNSLSTQASTRFGVDDISYFEISGVDEYQKNIVKKDMRSIEPGEISFLTRDSTAVDTAFLRVIVRGKKLNLLELVDSKYHYYIQKHDEVPQELIYRLSMDTVAEDLRTKGNDVRIFYTFRTQLQQFADDIELDKLDASIARAQYNEGDLAKIVLAIDGGVAVSRNSQANPAVKPRLFISAGLDRPGCTIAKADELLAGMKFKTQFSPSLRVGLDLFPSRNFTDWVFRFEVGFTHLTYNGRDDLSLLATAQPQYQLYKIVQNNIDPSASVLYNFGTESHVRFYIGAGITLHYSSYAINRYTRVEQENPYVATSIDNYADLQKIWPSYFVRIGLKINQKVEIGAYAELLGIMAVNDSFMLNANDLSLRITYFFGKRVKI